LSQVNDILTLGARTHTDSQKKSQVAANFKGWYTNKICEQSETTAPHLAKLSPFYDRALEADKYSPATSRADATLKLLVSIYLSATVYIRYSN
jgi:hypothetical protein